MILVWIIPSLYNHNSVNTIEDMMNSSLVLKCLVMTWHEKIRLMCMYTLPRGGKIKYNGRPGWQLPTHWIWLNLLTQVMTSITHSMCYAPGAVIYICHGIYVCQSTYIHTYIRTYVKWPTLGSTMIWVLYK